MEMDELLKRLEEFKDGWKEQRFGGDNYEEGIDSGRLFCSDDISDLLDLVRQTKKG